MFNQAIAIVVSILVITGCSEFSKIWAERCNGEVCFTAEETASTTYGVHYAAVTKLTCKTDCIYWEVHLPPDDTPMDLLSKPLKYGHTFENMVVQTPAKPLQEGEYEIMAIVEFNNEDGTKNGAKLSGTFKLDNNGSLVLE